MQDRPYRHLLVQTEGPRQTIALNNPKRRNAIGAAMVNELLVALEDAHESADVRVIVLTGAGDRAFCAGGDFSQMSAAEDAFAGKGDYADLLAALWRAHKPVIARVNGHAMGGGLGLVAACHFAICTDRAKLGTPEIEVGLFPMMIMAVLRRIMRHRDVVEMMLLGRKFDASEAHRLGLVGEVVTPEALDERVQALVDELAAKSPMAMTLGLRAMADSEELTLDEALPLLRKRLHECVSTEDAQEGLMAFMEKRKPNWKGR